MHKPDNIKEEYLKKLFREALLEEMNRPRAKNLIRAIVRRRLGSLPEYTDVGETAEKCKSEILRIVDDQFSRAGAYANREKFKNQKLINFQVKKDYIRSYLKTAINTYCTAKQVKCHTGRKKIVDDQGNVIQTEKKRGKASRAAEGQYTLDISHTIKSFGLSNISQDAIDDTTQYLKKLHLNDKEILCFWNRMDGETFVGMAKEYQESNATKTKSPPDLYRKRYQRLIKKIGSKLDKVFDLMTRDSHL